MIRAAVALSLAAAVACSPVTARADNNPDAFAPHRLDLSTLDKSYRRAQARRNGGISLAIPGVALNILGTVLFAYGALSGQPLLNEGVQIVSGAIVAVIGLAIAIPGVVLWILGQDNMDVLTWRRRQLTAVRLRPVIAPLRDGAALGLSLTF